MDEPQGNFNIRNADIEERLREIGKMVKHHTPQGWGFTVLMYDFPEAQIEHPSALFYISNANREDVIKAMKEFIRRNEH
jgi:hypothetical protein